jgi:hypothetical protein
MTGPRRLLVAIVLLATGAACSSGDRAESERQGAATTTAPADGAAADDAGEVTEPAAPPAETGPTSVFSGVTTAPTVPTSGFEIALSGAVAAKASGEARTRCVKGNGFFDVDVVPEPPLSAGAIAIASMNFGAPKFRGPGRYDAAGADDAEWSVGLVEVENGAPLEFYSPLQGPSGTITIADDGKSGRFEIRGLLDDEGRTLAAVGRFTCGTVEG